MTARIFSHESLRPDSQVELTGNAALHLGKVLRLREGDEIVVFDGGGLEYDGRIDSLTRQRVTVSVGTPRDPHTESGLDVTLHDERFTTLTAEQALLEGGMRRSERRDVRDKVAAAVLLQAYLDRENQRRERTTGDNS